LIALQPGTSTGELKDLGGWKSRLLVDPWRTGASVDKKVWVEVVEENGEISYTDEKGTLGLYTRRIVL